VRLWNASYPNSRNMARILKPIIKKTVYIGVTIFRYADTVCGSDFKLDKNGVVTTLGCTPEYVITYGYSGSYKYDTIEEAKASIDRIYEASIQLYLADRNGQLKLAEADWATDMNNA